MTRSMEPSAGAMRHLLLFLPLLALAACKPPASDDYVARVPIEERADAVRRLGQVLRDHEQELCELMTAEMGKPVAQGAPEVQRIEAPETAEDSWSDGMDAFVVAWYARRGMGCRIIRAAPRGWCSARSCPRPVHGLGRGCI